MIYRFILATALGYLLGSIPFGFMATRRTKGVDVRNYGSGKTGATNVIRTRGVLAGIIVLACDLAKGALAIFLGGLIMGDVVGSIGGMEVDRQDAQMASGIAAIIGHIWPVYIGFRGGRGVTTFMGGLLFLRWPTALICGGDHIGHDLHNPLFFLRLLDRSFILRGGHDPPGLTMEPTGRVFNICRGRSSYHP